MCDRSQHLGGPDIRASIHSYSAIRISQRRRPFGSVVAVVGFVQERIPVAVRRVASANILVDHNVTARCSLMSKIDAIVVLFIVRSSREKNWESSWCRGAVNIGTKHSAIAHCHCDAVFNSHGIRLGGERESRNERQNCERIDQDNFMDSPDIQAHHSFSVSFSTSRIKPKRSGT